MAVYCHLTYSIHGDLTHLRMFELFESQNMTLSKMLEYVTVSPHTKQAI